VEEVHELRAFDIRAIRRIGDLERGNDKRHGD